MWDESNKPIWLRWHDVGLLNLEKKYEEALRKGKELLEKFPQEQDKSAWATLADSYKGLGLEKEAEAALQEGIRRHPQSPIYCLLIGNSLARKSTGNSELRQAAILNWKNAMHFARIEEPLNSAYDYLKDEIDVLTQMPLDRAYPSVDAKVTEILQQLQSCGLFDGKTIDDLGRELAEIHPSIVRPDKEGKVNVADLISAEKRRYLLIDWRFSVEEVLKEVSSQAHETRLEFSNITDTLRWLGYRTISFSLNGHQAKKTVSGASGLFGLVNSCLRKKGCSRLYFQAYRWTLEDCSHFLLLSEAEMKKLRAAKLIPISRI
jgi:tetratricopeptide (TPR) repeat protein